MPGWYDALFFILVIINIQPGIIFYIFTLTNKQTNEHTKTIHQDEAMQNGITTD
jgi:hypothetical protein